MADHALDAVRGSRSAAAHPAGLLDHEQIGGSKHIGQPRHAHARDGAPTAASPPTTSSPPRPSSELEPLERRLSSMPDRANRSRQNWSHHLEPAVLLGRDRLRSQRVGGHARRCRQDAPSLLLLVLRVVRATGPRAGEQRDDRVEHACAFADTAAFSSPSIRRRLVRPGMKLIPRGAGTHSLVRIDAREHGLAHHRPRRR